METDQGNSRSFEGWYNIIYIGNIYITLTNIMSKIFFHATQHMSLSRYPTLTASIPIYNWLLDKLEDFEESASSDVKNGIQKAKEKLKTYYIKTDSSVYTVATSKARNNKLAGERISVLTQ